MINKADDYLKKDKGIIIAADVVSLDKLKKLVKIIASVPEVCAIKIGFTLALRYGLAETVDAIKGISDVSVIYDHQKAGSDIPDMAEPFAEVCREAGVNGAIIFPSAGPKTLEAFVFAALNAGLVPIVGMAMSHPAYLASEGGFIIDTAPDEISRIAIEAGVRDFVLPGNKLNLLRHFANGVLTHVRPARIMMPGIGSQGGTIPEAFSAIDGHYPYAIIGSAIYNAKVPELALEQFALEVRT